MRSTIPEGETLVLNLVFPAEWRQHRNPLAESAAAWARAFLADCGLGVNPEADHRLARMDLAGYGGWLFYAAERGVLCTVTTFYALWMLYQSEIDGRGEAEEAALVAAVRGEGGRPQNPYHAAFWELGQRYAKKLGRTFLSRHAERFRAWLRSLKGETELCCLESYLELQRVRIGVLPTLDFLELDLGEELAPCLWNDPRMSTLERLAAEIVALQQDLALLAVGAGRRRPNAISLLQEEESLPALEACRQIALRHNNKVQELDRVGRAMVRDHRVATLTAWWIRCGGMIAGFGRFYCDAARNAGPLALDGHDIRLTLDELEEADFTESSVHTGAWNLPSLMSWLAVPTAG